MVRQLRARKLTRSLVDQFFHHLVPTATCLLLTAAAAPARDAEPSLSTDGAQPLDEIVVTAQKRLSTVQDTPISITAVSGEGFAISWYTVACFAGASHTPGVSLKSEGPSQTEIEMRGMTSSGGNSATVGFYLDDIPLMGSASAQNGHSVIDPDLYDLSRIEVLRGPPRHSVWIGIDGRHGATH